MLTDLQKFLIRLTTGKRSRKTQKSPLPRARTHDSYGSPSPILVDIRALQGAGILPGADIALDSALPAPASNVLALANDSGATVQWIWNKPIPPKAVVTAFPGGAQIVVNSTGTIRGSATFPWGTLNNGTSYVFFVASINQNGQAGRNSVQSNAITPSALPGRILPVTRQLEFWWSARQTASPPSNGAALPSLVDLSGNGYNFAGNNGGGTWVSSWSSAKPAFALNGSSQFYDSLASGYLSGMRGPNCSIYILFDVTSNPNGIGYLLSAMRPDPLASILPRSFGLGTKLGSASNSNVIVMDQASDYYSNASALVTGGNIPWSTVIRATVKLPGQLRTQGNPIPGQLSPRSFGGAGAQPWVIGSMYGGGFNYYHAGRIAEIAIFADTMTAAEDAALETYLATGA